MKLNKNMAMLCALMAALLYGISLPFSKMLLAEIPSTLLGAILYLGAGAGTALTLLTRRRSDTERREARIKRKEYPVLLGIIGLDIAAVMLLLFGLTLTNASNASLLNNFEIVATSLVAVTIFREKLTRQIWLAILLITLSCAVLSFDGTGSLNFSVGSVFILLGTACWGFENNCTRLLSINDPLEIVAFKGIGSGLGTLAIALCLNQTSHNIIFILLGLALGFGSYGLSLSFYILAQRELGAARTSAYYAITPFIGAGLSFAVFRDTPTLAFAIALPIMIAAILFIAREKHHHMHSHESAAHEHRHCHEDGHHNHTHEPPARGEHCHLHTHEALTHGHSHMFDVHHTHAH